MTRYALTRPDRLSLAALAGRTGVHPDLIRRFVALCLLDASHDAAGQLWFAMTAPAVVARIQRLHAGLSLNYNAIGLVLDLLDRIERLEAALRRQRSSWT
jgi:chaperone modulatory protein CbpM